MPGRATSREEHPRRTRRLRVAVVSDQAMVADAVAAALRDRDLDASSRPWAAAATNAGSDGGQARPPPADVGLALGETERFDLPRAAHDLVGSGSATRWIIMTSVPEGPLWSAASYAGVSLVLPRTVSLDALAAAVDAVARGHHSRAVDHPALGVSRGRRRSERGVMPPALDSLTTSEREVLELLYRGMSVPKIAESRGVTVTTVRHQVRSVRRKLGVSSQIAAVAHYARLREHSDDDGAVGPP